MQIQRITRASRCANVVWPDLALGTMALRAVLHALDPLTDWTMDRYIEHIISLWRPDQMGHSTSLATHVKHLNVIDEKMLGA